VWDNRVDRLGGLKTCLPGPKGRKHETRQTSGARPLHKSGRNQANPILGGKVFGHLAWNSGWAVARRGDGQLQPGPARQRKKGTMPSGAEKALIPPCSKNRYSQGGKGGHSAGKEDAGGDRKILGGGQIPGSSEKEGTLNHVGPCPICQAS